jgi:PAS domain S-box-containing protein
MGRENQLLIVDDNAATRYAMRRSLERHGYRVLEAGTGGEGLALIGDTQLDALILDVNLPDMSGFDIVRQLRADPHTALLPVIHVSAASMHTGDIITGLEAGADAYLIHPVDPDVLLATLRTLLRVRDTEQALSQSEARFREIFSRVMAPIAVVDSTLQMRECNRAFSQLVGSACDDHLSNCVVPGQDATLEELQRRLRAGMRWQCELHMQVNGSLRETHWQVSPYRAPDLGLVFVEDVTEQRQRERSQLEQLDTATSELAREVAERVRTQAQLMQVQKMDALGKLTGGIAHDFNNLLTGIITSIELMQKRIADGRADGVLRLAETAMNSARSAASMTNRLLAFARQQPLDARAVDINEQIRSLGELLRLTVGDRIELEVELAAQGAIAQVDANQLESAVLNLVINARDALPEGGCVTIGTGSLQARGDRDLADGDYISISVRDNGVGIAPDVVDKVFEPFFTTKPLGQGTGLGLSSIYGFARQSGGDARLQSTPGVGTQVTLLLPAAQGKVEPTVDVGPMARGGEEHVLIVEDMPAVRMLVVEMLREAGYRCSEAPDVTTALSVLRDDSSIDLLLTDVGLPGLSGRQLADAARELQKDLPVLFMTGYAQNAVSRERFLGEQMDMVTKPFQPGELLGKLRQLLDGQGR